MNLEQFNQVTRDHNRIPLVREVFADLDTPLSAYLKLADEPYTYLFESVQGGEKWGRYSIIGMACSTRIKVFGNRLHCSKSMMQIVSEEETDDPLQFIENYLSSVSRSPRPSACPSSMVAWSAISVTIRFVISSRNWRIVPIPINIKRLTFC